MGRGCIKSINVALKLLWHCNYNSIECLRVTILYFFTCNFVFLFVYISRLWALYHFNFGSRCIYAGKLDLIKRLEERKKRNSFQLEKKYLKMLFLLKISTSTNEWRLWLQHQQLVRFFCIQKKLFFHLWQKLHFSTIFFSSRLNSQLFSVRFMM